MPTFASTTTSGYSDPLKAMSIKALEQRLKDQQAQMAAQQPDAAMMSTIPGGIGHVLGVVGDRMNQSRQEQALAANRDMLAKAISGYDPDSGPPPAAIATTSPELYNSLLSAWAENRRARETNQVQYRGQDITSRGQDVTAATAARGQDIDARGQDVTARGQDIVAGTAARGQDVTTRGQDIVSADTARGQDITARGQDIVSADTQRTQDITARGQDVTARGQDIAADTTVRGQDVTARGQDIGADVTVRGQDVGAGTAVRGQDVQARGQDIGADVTVRGQDVGAQTATRGQDVQTRGQDLGADVTTRGQDVTARGQDMTAATAAAEAEAKAKALASDPKRLEAIKTAETDYRKALSHIDNLEEATKILQHPKGIYTGAAQSLAPIAGGLPGGGMVVDKEKAQNTARFNTIVGEDAIRDMATTLKGSSTNYEMGEFKKMKNDPNISDAQRAAQLQKVVKAARADLEAQAKEVQAIGGDVTRVDRAMSGGGDAPAAVAADPLEGKIADGPDGPLVRRGGKWVKQ